MYKRWDENEICRFCYITRMRSAASEHSANFKKY